MCVCVCIYWYRIGNLRQKLFFSQINFDQYSMKYERPWNEIRMKMCLWIYWQRSKVDFVCVCVGWLNIFLNVSCLCFYDDLWWIWPPLGFHWNETGLYFLVYWRAVTCFYSHWVCLEAEIISRVGWVKKLFWLKNLFMIFESNKKFIKFLLNFVNKNIWKWI